jgi:septin family protein
MRLYQVLGMLTLAMPLVACGPSGTTSVTGLNNLLGKDLLSARGATRDDQRKIDKTVEGGIRAGIWNRQDVPIAAPVSAKRHSTPTS